MAAYIIDYEPVGRRGECKSDESILACARRLGLGISTICGGKGICYSCKVQVISGIVSDATSSEQKAFPAEELSQGWRLACQIYPAGDCKIMVPPESMTSSQRVQVEGLRVAVNADPPVKSYHLKLTFPSLSSQVADADRLITALNEQYQLDCVKIDINVLRRLSDQLRAWNWTCQAIVRNDEIVALAPAGSRQLGLAIDLGTTKIAGYLIDLSDGLALSAKGVMNPQISYGEDIITRIAEVVHSPDNGLVLQRLVVETIDKLCNELCTEQGFEAKEVTEAVVVGNTAMHHLFLNLPVRQLAVSPFVPVTSSAVEVKAIDIGMHIAPGAYVYLIPNIAGFVGADHVSALLATYHLISAGATLVIDIGTNTEVSLVNKDEIIATSCASGPAFEGGHIKNGMRAAAGAIERLRIEGSNIQYQTVDNVSPIGICGSGILDAVSQLYLAGVINKGGKIDGSHPRLRVSNGQHEFVLVAEEERNGQPAITITQQDIREVQLAKSAIRAGIQTILEVNGCSEDKITQVLIAGAFGSYIDVNSAITIGLLPALPLNRFQQVGNAAGIGAKLALVSQAKRSEAKVIASRVRYIELASSPNFNQNFIQAGYLGRYIITNGKREELN